MTLIRRLAAILTLNAWILTTSAGTVTAFVYATNAVGYVNTSLTPGLSLISNPLSREDSRIADLFANSSIVPDGATIYVLGSTGYVTARFDASLSQWVPPETAEIELLPGEG